MKPIYLLLLFFFVSSASAATVPNEVAQAKQAFENEVASFSTDRLEKLNAKYAAGLAVAKERAKARGNLEEVVALTRELESIEETGEPSNEAKAEGGEFEKLRGIYVTEISQIDEARQAAFRSAVARYQKKLKTLVAEFTKAGRIEDAVAARDAGVAAGNSKLTPLAGIEDSPVPALRSAPAVRRSGRLRGFGRTAGYQPADAEFDMSKFERYDDFVDIAGGMRSVFFLRENGDVLNHEAEVVGKKAEKISQFGYIDRSGDYHTLTSTNIPDAAQPLKTMDLLQDHGLAVNAAGELYGFKSDYEDGSRTVPDKAHQDIVQVACYWDGDYALNSKGNLFRWNKDGETQLPGEIADGVSFLSEADFHSAFVITEKNELFSLKGERPDAWSEKAKNVLTGGILWAVLAMDDRWHSFALEGKEPAGNELEILDTVLNRAETIDVQFYTYDAKGHWFGNYVIWIEENGGPELDFRNPDVLKKEAEKPRQPGTGFFGIPID